MNSGARPILIATAAAILLASFGELSTQALAKTNAETRNAWMRLYDRTSHAISNAVREREHRENLDRGQARIFLDTSIPFYCRRCADNALPQIPC